MYSCPQNGTARAQKALTPVFAVPHVRYAVPHVSGQPEHWATCTMICLLLHTFHRPLSLHFPLKTALTTLSFSSKLLFCHRQIDCGAYSSWSLWGLGSCNYRALSRNFMAAHLSTRLVERRGEKVQRSRERVPVMSCG